METDAQLPWNFRSILGCLPSKGDMSALDTNVVVMQILDPAREKVRSGKTVKLSKLGGIGDQHARPYMLLTYSRDLVR